MRLRFALVCLLCVAATALVTGCKSSGTAFNPPGGSHVTDKHMYIATETGIEIYDFPVTSTSTPIGEIPGPDYSLTTPFEDATGRLFASVFVSPYDTVDVFTQPISSSSSPAFTLTTNPQEVETTTEDSSGNVYESLCEGAIDVYDGPVTSSRSTPSFEITNDLICPGGMAFDSSGNLYVYDFGYSGLEEFPAPFSSSSAASVGVPWGDGDDSGLVAVDSSNRIFVPSYSGSAGYMAVFTTPLTDSSTPAFTITFGSEPTEGLAFDSSGNLWVNDQSGILWEVKAPITSSSTATQVLTGLNDPYSIDIGQ